MYVNTYNDVYSQAPFGGFKQVKDVNTIFSAKISLSQSGFGRELGTESIHSYTQVKTIITNVTNTLDAPF